VSDNLPAQVLVRSVGWDEPPVSGGGFVLPSGTVTLLLGDVEGSTRAWEADPKTTETAVVELNGVVDELVGRFDGVRPVEQGEGDSFVAAFGRARDAVGCALAIQQALVANPLGVRLGLHTGEVVRRDEGNYVGPAIIRTARLRDLAHGGQTVLSETARDLVLDGLPDGTSLRDLGVHRLKDLSRPERVFQLCHPDLPDAFPPLRSLDAHRHNLPVQRTTFIGRSVELAELSALVGDERLVTLTGSGGCGKTRLALQVAAEASDAFADGVWFADLSSVLDPDAVPAQVAQVFALKEGPGLSLTDGLLAYLGERRALVIVDNCEHVLDAAAGLVDAMLTGCPGISVIATSRQPLALEGEVAWRVPSLPVPVEHASAGIAGVSMCEAVQLFADRARRARPGFALSDGNAEAASEICRRLDGIPLAIELAAARVRVFTPAQIAEGLSERFRLLTGAARTALPRQQTLEASVDWSHALLTDIEQVVFRRLSVFAAGFGFDAAQQVCAGTGVEAHQVLDVLSLLVDKSLVVADVDDDEPDARYRLLETVRAYAAARLDAAGEETATRDRHRDQFLTLAEGAEVHCGQADEREWTTVVAREYPNLQAALSWSRERRDAEGLSRIAAGLIVFWSSHGPVDEGNRWLDAALDAGAELPAPQRAKVLFGRAWLATMDWDPTTILARGEEGLALARQLGDERLIGRCLIALGSLSALTGGSTSFLEEGIDQARRAGDRWALAAGLLWLGAWYIQQDPPKARTLFEEGVRVGADSNRMASNACLANLGGALCFEGRLDEARSVLNQALHNAEALRDPWAVGAALAFLASTATYGGEHDEVLQLVDRLERNARQAGQQVWYAWVPAFRGWAFLGLGDAARALPLAREAVRLAVVPVTRVYMLFMLVEVELALGLFDDARAHLEEQIQISEGASYSFPLGYGKVLAARLARRTADPAAETLAHEALSLAHPIDARVLAIQAIEVLGGIAADEQSHDEASRLFAAADAARTATGYARCVSERDSDLAALGFEMDPPAFDRAWAEGSTLSLDEAVAYARRGRGERKRPATGWASLTPTELQVVELVRQGLTNAEIGERLFVSTRTVQAHLTRIYGKLGVTGRTQLAARAAKPTQ
jgi:predicted ATPase/class 3 adenylate cyclase/DNA-binding CsgD family transcriptional regulator